MFVVKDHYELDWVVELLDTEVEVRFRLLTKEEMERVMSGSDPDLYWIKNHVVGWGEQIVDEGGKPVPFSTEVLESLCKQHPFFERRLALALVRASADGVAKNLSSGSAG